METSGGHEDEELVAESEDSGLKLSAGAAVMLKLDEFSSGKELVLKGEDGGVLAVVGRNPESNPKKGSAKNSYTLRTLFGHKILIPVPTLFSSSSAMQIGFNEESMLAADLLQDIKGLFRQDFEIDVMADGLRLINNSAGDEYYNFPGHGSGGILTTERMLAYGVEQIAAGEDGMITGLINGGRKFCAATYRELGSSKYYVRNEDNVGVNCGRGIMAIADGMGAYGYGEHAAYLAVESLINSGEGDLFKNLGAARDNLYIFNRMMRSVPSTNATVVAVKLDGDLCRIIYRGDCRFLLLRAGKCVFMTVPRNHAWNQYMTTGSLSYVGTFNNMQRSVVTGGLTSMFAPDYFEFVLESGDKLVMYDDGLAFSEAEIVEVVRDNDLEKAVNLLLEGTKSRNLDGEFPIKIDSDMLKMVMNANERAVGPGMNVNERPMAAAPYDNTSVVVYAHD